MHPQVNANKGTQVALAAKLGIVPSVLNSIIAKRKDTKNCYTKCDSFCGQRKDLKQSAFQEKESLLTACFKQDRAECHNYGTLLGEKTVHIVTRLGIDFRASNAWIQCCVQHCIRKVQSVNSSREEEYRNEQLLKNY